MGKQTVEQLEKAIEQLKADHANEILSIQKVAADKVEASQQVIEELQQKIDAADKGEDNTELADVVAELEAVKKEKEDLQLQYDGLNETNTLLTEEIEKLTQPGSVAAAAKKVEETPIPKLPTSPFEVNGQKYKFRFPAFVFKTENIIAEEALNNADLLQQLVDAKSGAIALVPVKVSEE